MSDPNQQGSSLSSASAPQIAEKSSGGSPVIWVTAITACSTIAVAFLQYLTQVTPLKNELEQLKRSSTSAGPDLNKATAEVQRLTAELEMSRKEEARLTKELSALKTKQPSEEPLVIDLTPSTKP